MKIKGIILGLALAAASILGSQANAQEVFKKGTNVASALIGTTTTNFNVLPIQISYEHGIVDGLLPAGKGSIGIGGSVGTYVANFFSNSFLGARGSFHYEFAPKWDTYAGLFLGTTVVSNGNNWNFAFGSNIHLGTRYYFTPDLAVNAEIGYGVSLLNIGISYRF